MTEEPDFRPASELMRKEAGWIHPNDKRVDVSSLPVCPKPPGCGHHVKAMPGNGSQCYDGDGYHVSCTCRCDLYLPKKTGCPSCGD